MLLVDLHLELQLHDTPQEEPALHRTIKSCGRAFSARSVWDRRRERFALRRYSQGKAREGEILVNHADTKRLKDSERRFAVVLSG